MTAEVLLTDLLQRIVAHPVTHAKWLNTLSLLENTGARKIAGAESPTSVTLEVLQHAAEEARHAFLLKKQIAKLQSMPCLTYQETELLAPRASRRYLHRLDGQISRLLKQNFHWQGQRLKWGAYLLVTYAIEVRALWFYPLYQQILEASQSPVSVKTIIAEERRHLQTMKSQLQTTFGDWHALAEQALALETQLYTRWLEPVQTAIGFESRTV